MSSRLVLLPAAAAAVLGGCATGGAWQRLEAEFPDVARNCGIAGASLGRDVRDRRLLRVALPARAQPSDTTLACVGNWARERGFRVGPFDASAAD